LANFLLYFVTVSDCICASHRGFKEHVKINLQCLLHICHFLNVPLLSVYVAGKKKEKKKKEKEKKMY